MEILRKNGDIQLVKYDCGLYAVERNNKSVGVTLKASENYFDMNDFYNATLVNIELDKCKMAYKIKDTEGNTFCFAGLENGFPLYRGQGGSKHIFDMNGYEVIKQYCEL